MTARRTLMVLAGVVAVVALTAASCDERGLGDAPVGQQYETPRKVWINLDSYPNIAAFCIGPNGIYTHTRPASPVVVVDDPNCREGGILRD